MCLVSSTPKSTDREANKMKDMFRCADVGYRRDIVRVLTRFLPAPGQAEQVVEMQRCKAKQDTMQDRKRADKNVV